MCHIKSREADALAFPSNSKLRTEKIQQGSAFSRLVTFGFFSSLPHSGQSYWSKPKAKLLVFCNLSCQNESYQIHAGPFPLPQRVFCPLTGVACLKYRAWGSGLSFSGSPCFSSFLQVIVWQAQVPVLHRAPWVMKWPALIPPHSPSIILGVLRTNDITCLRWQWSLSFVFVISVVTSPGSAHTDDYFYFYNFISLFVLLVFDAYWICFALFWFDHMIFRYHYPLKHPLTLLFHNQISKKNPKQSSVISDIGLMNSGTYL